jgi:hypothetical protein
LRNDRGDHFRRLRRQSLLDAPLGAQLHWMVLRTGRHWYHPHVGGHCTDIRRSPSAQCQKQTRAPETSSLRPRLINFKLENRHPKKLKIFHPRAYIFYRSEFIRHSHKLLERYFCRKVNLNKRYCIVKCSAHFFIFFCKNMNLLTRLILFN